MYSAVYLYIAAMRDHGIYRGMPRCHVMNVPQNFEAQHLTFDNSENVLNVVRIMKIKVPLNSKSTTVNVYQQYFIIGQPC